MPSSRSFLPVAIAILLVTVAGCSLAATPSPSSSTLVLLSQPPASTAATSTGSAASVFDLIVGDCFDTGDISTVDLVTIVDCDAPHAYEVFGTTDYETAGDETYPGDDVLSNAADEFCRPAFEAYVGISYGDSELFGTFINPSDQTWPQGDRKILCVANTRDQGPITGSVAGSER